MARQKMPMEAGVRQAEKQSKISAPLLAQNSHQCYTRQDGANPSYVMGEK